MSGNGIPKARIVDNAIPLMVDVSSTLLDLVGLPVPDASEGRSFVDCLDDGPCPVEEVWWAYALRHDTNRLSAIAGYRWPFKWIWRRSEDRRAYELEKDPWEKDNLLELAGEDRPDEIKRLAGGFRKKRREIVQLLQFQRRTIDHEKRLELLRSLGYIDPR